MTSVFAMFKSADICRHSATGSAQYLFLFTLEDVSQMKTMTSSKTTRLLIPQSRSENAPQSLSDHVQVETCCPSASSDECNYLDLSSGTTKNAAQCDKLSSGSDYSVL